MVTREVLPKLVFVVTLLFIYGIYRHGVLHVRPETLSFAQAREPEGPVPAATDKQSSAPKKEPVPAATETRSNGKEMLNSRTTLHSTLLKNQLRLNRFKSSNAKNRAAYHMKRSRKGPSDSYQSTTTIRGRQSHFPKPPYNKTAYDIMSVVS